MTIQQLASKVAKREGKKHEATISDIREIIKIICTLRAEQMLSAPNEDDQVFMCMNAYSDKIWFKLCNKFSRKKFPREKK